MVIYIEEYLARRFKAEPTMRARMIAAGGSRAPLSAAPRIGYRPSALTHPVICARMDETSPPAIRSIHELMQVYAEASLI